MPTPEPQVRLVFKFVPVAHPTKEVTVEINGLLTSIKGLQQLAEEVGKRNDVKVTVNDLVFAFFGSIEGFAQWARATKVEIGRN